MNQRQNQVLNRVLDGMEGKLTHAIFAKELASDLSPPQSSSPATSFILQ